MEPSINPQLIEQLRPVMETVVMTHPLVVQNRKSQPSLSPDQLASTLTTVVAQEIMRRLEKERQTNPKVRAFDVVVDPNNEKDLSNLIDSTIEQYLIPTDSPA